MLRALLTPGESASRIENRVAESGVNPYLALAFQLISGMDGLDQNLEAPEPLADPYGDDAELLPSNLLGAVETFAASDLFREALGPEFVTYLARLKRAEWDDYVGTVSEWEHAAYFANL